MFKGIKKANCNPYKLKLDSIEIYLYIKEITKNIRYENKNVASVRMAALTIRIILSENVKTASRQVSLYILMKSNS